MFRRFCSLKFMNFYKIKEECYEKNVLILCDINNFILFKWNHIKIIKLFTFEKF